MPTAGLERGHERKIEHLATRQKRRKRDRRIHRWQPGRAALLDGLDCGLTPLLGLRFGLLFEITYHPLGQQRHHATDAEFDRLLNDGFNQPALGHGLEQDDGAGGCRDHATLQHLEANRVTRDFRDDAFLHRPLPVQNGCCVAPPQTQHA